MEVLGSMVALLAGVAAGRWLVGRRDRTEAFAFGVFLAGSGVAASIWATAPPGLGGIVHVLLLGLTLQFVVAPSGVLALVLEVQHRRRETADSPRRRETNVDDGID